MSKRLVVVGSQWGDEGKGKITDWFACRADMVVRYQGGNNAGHSVAFNGKKYSLRSIPSGIFNPDTVNVMANGMVINPLSVIDELDILRQQGITDWQLRISNRATVVMPWHRMLDGAYEALKADSKIGTTKNGIGPAYSDKFSRIGIRMADLLEPEYFSERLRDALEIKNMELKMLGLETLDFNNVRDLYLNAAEVLAPMICDTSSLITDTLQLPDAKVLFEGAQGMMLCIDHGTFPYVTSSSPSSASVPQGAGIAPHWIDNVVGVAKAYCTRVGEGPFPTEIEGKIADEIRERGHEFGTVTGRPRRIGWLDAVVARYTGRLAGFSSWSIMLLDVLSGLDEIKICTAYELDGEIIQTPPPTISRLSRCKPVYTTLQGWKEDITGIKNINDLPLNARRYLDEIERLTGIPVGIVSVGPDRSQTIINDESLKLF